jgi:hypothetical protein
MLSNENAATDTVPCQLLSACHLPVTLQISITCERLFFSCQGTDGQHSPLSEKQEAAMANEPGTGTQQSRAPGTLEKFHLGLAADGMTCALVFVDEYHRSIACIASFADLNGFIVSLTRAAAEMARRRTLLMQDDASATDDDVAAVTGSGDDRQAAFNIASSTFRLCADDGYLVGALVDDGGQVVPVRIRPDVANEMTRNMLKTAQPASAC